MSSQTFTKTTVTCDSETVGGPACINVLMGPYGVNRVREEAKRQGWSHRHWCSTKIDLCPNHTDLPLPKCESKGGRPRRDRRTA